jgi:glucan biosynthesis protein
MESAAVQHELLQNNMQLTTRVKNTSTFIHEHFNFHSQLSTSLPMSNAASSKPDNSIIYEQQLKEIKYREYRVMKASKEAALYNEVRCLPVPHSL